MIISVMLRFSLVIKSGQDNSCMENGRLLLMKDDTEKIRKS